MWQPKFVVLICSLASLLFATMTFGDEEHPPVTSNSSEFERGYQSSVSQLESLGFGPELQSFSLGAINSTDLTRLAAEINREAPIPGVSLGDPQVTYDVILQPGHYGRKSGAVGTTGGRVRERALVAYITARVASALQDRHFSVLVISADQYARNLKGKVFLAIHADGNPHPCTTGPSLAYSNPSSVFAMHAIGWALGSALGYSYDEFKRDNFTANEAHYYMFSRLQAPTMKGLLELGELTCPAMEDKLINASDTIAANIASALSFIKRVSDRHASNQPPSAVGFASLSSSTR